MLEIGEESARSSATGDINVGPGMAMHNP